MVRNTKLDRGNSDINVPHRFVANFSYQLPIKLEGWKDVAFGNWQANGIVTRSDGIPFVSAQNHYSLLARASEREVIPAAERFGLGFLPYFPLHNGLLTGKFSRDHAPEDTRIMRQRQHVWREAPWGELEQLQAFCDERGITMLEATFGWLLAKPVLASVIAGATSPEQVRANAAAATAWSPTADDIAAIDALFPLPEDPGAKV